MGNTPDGQDWLMRPVLRGLADEASRTARCLRTWRS